MATAATLAEIRLELRAQVVGNDQSPQITVGTITVPVTATVLEGTEVGVVLQLHPSTEEITAIVEQIAERLSLVPIRS